MQYKTAGEFAAAFLVIIDDPKQMVSPGMDCLKQLQCIQMIFSASKRYHAPVGKS
jgi:hypothetical protein